MIRLRITFAKTEAMRFTSHLDLHKTWERTLRRAGLPLAYSQGFNPRPKLQLAAALPLGFTSRCEVLDAWLGGDSPPLAEIGAQLDRAAPPGLRVLEAEVVEEGIPPLQTQVKSAVYSAVLLDPIEDLEDRIADLLEAGSLPRQRRGKDYDLKPLIETLEVLPPNINGDQRLSMQLAAQEGRTGRPEEVLAAIGADPAASRVERSQLVFI